MKIISQIVLLLCCGLPAHAQIKSDDNLRTFISGLGTSGVYAGFDAISKWVLLFGLILAVLAYIAAGIAFFTSRGEQARLEAAKKTIAYATVGTALIVVARGMVVIIGKFFS